MIGSQHRGIVIVGCGEKKLDRPAPAGKLYTGAYFSSCATTAAAIAPGRWYVLSARYGLVAPSRVLEPYDLTMWQPGAVDAAEVRRQAAALGLLDETVAALCGRRYADVIADAWSGHGYVMRPLAGQGIGQQRHVLAQLRAAASTSAG
jgi:hypothetical protein